MAARDLTQDRLEWCGIRMYRVPPRRDEVERFETPLFGPDPAGIWAYRGPSGQWGAAFHDGMCAYGHSFEEAMEAARLKAIGLLLYEVSRLEALPWRIW